MLEFSVKVLLFTIQVVIYQTSLDSYMILTFLKFLCLAYLCGFKVLQVYTERKAFITVENVAEVVLYYLVIYVHIHHDPSIVITGPDDPLLNQIVPMFLLHQMILIMTDLVVF